MLIFGLTEPNELIYNVLRKLAIDSCIPFNVEFARILHNHPEGISRNELEFELQIPSTNVHRICNDLLQLGIIRVRAESNGKKSGRPKHVYVLNPVIASLWDATVESDFNVRVQSEAPVVRRRKQNESSSVSSDQSVELPERNQTRRRVKRTPNRTFNET